MDLVRQAEKDDQKNIQFKTFFDSTSQVIQVLQKIQKNTTQEDSPCELICFSKSFYDQIQKIMEQIKQNEEYEEKQTTPYNYSTSEDNEEEDEDFNNEDSEDEEIEQQVLLQEYNMDSKIEVDKTLDQSQIFGIKKQSDQKNTIIDIKVKSYNDALVLNSYFINYPDDRFQIVKPQQETKFFHKLEIKLLKESKNQHHQFEKIKEEIKKKIFEVNDRLYQFKFYLPKDQYLQLRNSKKLQSYIYDTYKVNFAYDINFIHQSNPDNTRLYFILYGESSSYFQEAFEYIIKSKLVKIYLLSLSTSIHSQKFSDSQYRRFLATSRMELLKKKNHEKEIYEVCSLEIQKIKHKQSIIMDYKNDFETNYSNIFKYFNERICWFIFSKDKLNGSHPMKNFYSEVQHDGSIICSFITDFQYFQKYLKQILLNPENKSKIQQIVVLKKFFVISDLDNFEKIEFQPEQELQKSILKIEKYHQIIKNNIDKELKQQLEKIKFQMMEREKNCSLYLAGKGRYYGCQKQLQKNKDPQSKSKQQAAERQQKSSQDLIQKTLPLKQPNNLDFNPIKEQLQKQQEMPNKPTLLQPQSLFQQQQTQVKSQQNLQRDANIPQQSNIFSEKNTNSQTNWQNYINSYNSTQEQTKSSTINSFQGDTYQNEQNHEIRKYLKNQNLNVQENQSNNQIPAHQAINKVSYKSSQNDVINLKPNNYDLIDEERKQNEPFRQEADESDIKSKLNTDESQDISNMNIQKNNNQQPSQNIFGQQEFFMNGQIKNNEINQFPTQQESKSPYFTFQDSQQQNEPVNQRTQLFQQENQSNQIGNQNQITNNFNQQQSHQQFQPEKEKSLTNGIMNKEKQEKIKVTFQEGKQKLEKKDLDNLEPAIKKLCSLCQSVFKYDCQQNASKMTGAKFYYAKFEKDSQFHLKETNQQIQSNYIFIFKVSEEFLVKQDNQIYLRDNFDGFPILSVLRY